jgi:Zn-dependent protease
MDIQELLLLLSKVLIPGVFAITLHEVAHGWTAKILGDPTASMLGRLTVNPLKHVDPIGTVLVPIALLLFAPPGMIFGWAKPVPIDPRRLRNPRRDELLVAVAGPVSNLLMAGVWALIANPAIAYLEPSSPLAEWVVGMCIFGMLINIILAVFNLLPIPPLDGWRVIAVWLPEKTLDVIRRVEPFGLIFVILLMVSGMLGAILERPANSLLAVYHSVAGLA